MDIFTPKLIALLVFIMIVLIGYAFTVRKSSIDARFSTLEKSKGMTKYLALLGQETVKIIPERVVKTNRVKEGSISARLRRAGNPWGVTVTEFLVLKIGACVAGILLGVFAYFAAKDYISIPAPVFILAFGAVGYIYPDHTLSKKEKERTIAFRRELPDALELLVDSTSVMNSIEAAMPSVTPLLREGIVKQEFQRVCDDLDAKRGIVDALTDMAERAPSPDIEAFVNIVIQSKTTGTDITQALLRRAKTSRQEYIALIDNKIASLESKIMAMLMPTMVGALMVVAVGPSLVSIFGALGGSGGSLI
jgi:pilus assembly protein TadC